jgi:general stress protein 26
MDGLMSNETENGRERFHELLKSFRAVSLVTRNYASATGSGPDDGPEFSARPMQVARLDDNCDLWFLTDADTAKVYEIRSDANVLVVGQSGDDRFIALSGTARVQQDQATIRELFSEPYKVWFPDGPETPGIRAIHVNAIEGDFWDSTGASKVKYMLQAAKAYATGSRPKTDAGEQSGHVKL